MSDPSHDSVRDLLTELAHLEDAVRAARTRWPHGRSGHPSAEVAALLAREDEIVAALRTARLGAR